MAGEFGQRHKFVNGKFAVAQTGEEYVSRYTKEFTYVSGFEGCDKEMIVEHKACGYRFEISGVSIRHARTKCIRCPKCVFVAKYIKQIGNRIYKGVKRDVRKANADKRKQLENERFERKIEKLKSRKPIEDLQKGMIEMTCNECGKSFLDYRKSVSYCSDDCRTKAKNKNADERLIRFNTEIIDDIKLDEVIKAFNNECQICGRICSEDRNSEAGPTIEHIVPLARGGKHCWSNVTLACRSCNSSKSDYTMEEYKQKVVQGDVGEKILERVKRYSPMWFQGLLPT